MITIGHKLALAAVALGSMALGGDRGGERHPPFAESPPGEAFSLAAVALHHAGWQLRRIEILDAPGQYEIAIVLADTEKARRLVLTMSPDGGSPRRFTESDLPLPEPRVYRSEQALWQALGSGPVLEVMVGCDEYLLAVGQETDPVTVAFEPDDYYLVADEARGEPARRRSAAALVQAVEDGMALVRVIDRDDDVELVFGGRDEEIAVQLALAPDGRVVGYELRTSPPRPIVRFYEPRAATEIARQVRAAPALRRVTRRDRPGESSTEGGLELELRNGRSVSIAWARFLDVDADDLSPSRLLETRS